MNIVFWIARPTKEVGYGHTARCTALGQAFEALGHSYSFIHSLCDYGGFGVCRPSSTAAGDEVGGLNRAGDIVVVDNYGATQAHIGALRSMGACVALIADHETSLHADITISPGLGAVPGYALLRREFWEVRPIEIRPRVENVFLSLGGTDPQGRTALLREALSRAMPHAAIHTTPDALGTHSLSAAEMVAVMRRCDIAVSAAGGTARELFALGIPSLFIVQAQNQRGNARFLRKHGLLLPNPDPHEVAKAVAALAQDHPRRRHISSLMATTKAHTTLDAAQHICRCAENRGALPHHPTRFL